MTAWIGQPLVPYGWHLSGRVVDSTVVCRGVESPVSTEVAAAQTHFQPRIQSAQRRGSIDGEATGRIPLQHRNYLPDRRPNCDLQANSYPGTYRQGSASMSVAKIRRGHIGDTLSCFLRFLE